MKHLFTPEEMKPSKDTILFIKRMAYSYCNFKLMNGHNKMYLQS